MGKEPKQKNDTDAHFLLKTSATEFRMMFMF